MRTTLLGNVRYEVDSHAQLKEGKQGATPKSDKSNEVSNQIWQLLDNKYSQDTSVASQWKGRMFAFRAASMSGWGNFKPSPTQRIRGSNPTVQALLKRWRWQTAMWTDGDRAEFDIAMQEAFTSLIKLNPDLKRISY